VAILFFLVQGVDFRRPCDQLVLLHLKRTHLMEWVRAVVAVALGVGRQQQLPPIWLQQETDVVWEQLGELSALSRTV
jgi:protein O-GlcNAc transferase